MSKRPEEMNIMIVDDEEKICELIKIFLESAYKFNSVVSAPNAAQAMQKFANQEFDLVILDHVMPGKPGIEFIEHLKSSVRFSKLKILLISGYLQEEDVLTAIKFGVKHIVVKPFSRQQLLTHVAELLKLDPLEEKAS